jgi:hypothetical protein
MEYKILNILEQMAEICKQLSEQLYSSFDYNDSSYDIYADRFHNILQEIDKIKEELKK